MLTLYPSNKLEHLSYLLGTLLHQQPGPVLGAETILVESPGMQHWLNMQLASQQGIAMNLRFPLPTRFMWETARTILGADRVPQQSVYRREVLTWRIDDILVSDAFCQHPDSGSVCHYWQHIDDEVEQGVQRLQFATALADVFEQYLLYRPQWLFAWEKNQTLLHGSEEERWQGQIWRQLVAQHPLHPARLHAQAIEALDGEQEYRLPSRVIVFAINTMAPQLVQFLDALAKHTHVHLFHLNPSVNYWGDVKSDRDRAKILRTQGVEAFRALQQDNPLLSNLGRQGRDLFNLLTELDTFEISAFDVEAPDEDTRQSNSVLKALQQDTFKAQAPSGCFNTSKDDTSIIVAQAHSSLREVQGLHDTLLELFNQDSELKPSDVVVMCPAIEDYAPLIDAVFHRVGTPATDETTPPRIPCSIADRAPLDAQPLIASFINLLSLPDSRFEVTEIMTYLRQDAAQAKFGINADSLAIMEQWLRQAHVHWGLSTEHKQNLTDDVNSIGTYSWWWGLKRLLIGMACQDEPVVVDDVLTVPNVEGQNAVVLGKLIEVVERLQRHAQELKTPRTAEQWHEYLVTLRDSCFSPVSEQLDTWESIARASADVAAHCEEAEFSQTLTLRQIRDVLIKRFSRPDAANHFLTGQVTFCSMLPMRSIPFKVVCILGLNDGDFPRQSQPISIDLMAKQPAQQGDRSRRMEDRYLFLEALVSTRQHLYLSYQSRSAQDNSERQPSLVLSELLTVLEQGYQYKLTDHARQLPLHPFSPASFTPPHPGYEAGWHRLAVAVREPVAQDNIPITDGAEATHVTASQLAKCFVHPARYYANQHLGVYLGTHEPVLNDTEPFTADPLTRYQALNEISQAALAQSEIAPVVQKWILGGDLPATPLTQTLSESWRQAAEDLVAAVDAESAEMVHLTWHSDNGSISCKALVDDQSLMTIHTGKQSVARQLEQFLTLLVFNACDHPLPLKTCYLSWQNNQHTLRAAHFSALARPQANELLEHYLKMAVQVQQSPRLFFAEVAMAFLKSAKQTPLTQWAESVAAKAEWNKLYEGQPNDQNGLADDPYVKWLFPAGISFAQLPLADMETLYRPLCEGHKDVKL